MTGGMTGNIGINMVTGATGVGIAMGGTGEGTIVRMTASGHGVGAETDIGMARRIGRGTATDIVTGIETMIVDSGQSGDDERHNQLYF